MSVALIRAQKAWGNHLPDWVEVLANECDFKSQRAVAVKLKRSTTVVNLVLGNKYPGDMKGAEALVRGVFMKATVTCPELGELPSNECEEWKRKSKEYGSANAIRVRMYRACNRCDRNKREVDDVKV